MCSSIRRVTRWCRHQPVLPTTCFSAEVRSVCSLNSLSKSACSRPQRSLKPPIYCSTFRDFQSRTIRSFTPRCSYCSLSFPQVCFCVNRFPPSESKSVRANSEAVFCREFLKLENTVTLQSWESSLLFVVCCCYFRFSRRVARQSLFILITTFSLPFYLFPPFDSDVAAETRLF